MIDEYISAEVFSQKDEQELSRLKKELQDACKSQSDIRFVGLMHIIREKNQSIDRFKVNAKLHQTQPG